MNTRDYIDILELGIHDWNNWRIINNNKNIPIDLSAIPFQELILRKFKFSYINFSYTKISYTNLTDIDLNHANLNHIDLDYANLTYANLNHANLSEANLSHVNLNNADLNYTNLSNGNLNSSNLTNANLNGANLTNANLSYADLTDANLTKVNLKNANFSEADLTNANLTKVIAKGANFEGSNLTGINIENWKIDNETNFDNIICDYIYLKKNYNQEDNQWYLERFPKDRNFKQEEFIQFFNKLQNTIELILYQPITHIVQFASVLYEINSFIEEKFGIEAYLKEYKVLENQSVSLKIKLPPAANPYLDTLQRELQLLINNSQILSLEAQLEKQEKNSPSNDKQLSLSAKIHDEKIENKEEYIEDEIQEDEEEEEEIYPMPKSVGMIASGIPDLAQTCEEWLWGRKSEKE